MVDETNGSAEIDVTDFVSIKKIARGCVIVDEDASFVPEYDANLDKGGVHGVVFVEKQEEEIVGHGPRDFSLTKHESNLDDENACDLVVMHVLDAEIGDANESTKNNMNPFGQVVEEQPEVVQLKNEAVDGYITCSNQQGSVSNVSKNGEMCNEASVSKISLINEDETIQEENNSMCSFSVDNAEKEPNIGKTAVEGKPQLIMGWMTAVGYVPVIDIDRDKDQEDSKFQMPFAETIEDSVSVDRAPNREAWHITKCPSPINPVEEHPKMDFRSIVDFDKDKDHGGSVSTMSLTCTSQDIKEEGRDLSNSISTYETIEHPVDYITKDTKPAEMETDAHDASVVDFGDDKDQHPIFRISLLDIEQTIQENDDIGLDSICFDATLSYQIDGDNDDRNLANLVLEVKDPDSIQADQNLMSRQDIGAELDRFTTVPVVEAENWNARHKEKESIQVLNANTGSLGLVDVGNALVNVISDAEQNLQVGNEELLKETEKQVIQTVENDQHVNYHLPPIDENYFSIYDLVWGKVKNHPWWPGQIFDPSDASNLAMKYHQKDSFLIGYYGGKTFAWCDKSQLKPFYSHFSKLEKQCSLDTFMKAISDILVEVSRRIKLGMACSCLPQDEYTGIQYQKVKNAGIRGGNINTIIDRPTISYYFQPDNLLEYIRTLAQFPNGTVDRLEFMIAQCQLEAFYNSKGYPALSVFAMSGGLIKSTPDTSPSIGKGFSEEILENCTPAFSDLRGRPFNEQEHGFENGEKLKGIATLAESRTSAHLANGGKIISVTKVSENSILSSSSKKHIVVKSNPFDLKRCNNRIFDSFGDIELKPSSPTVTGSFKIAESLSRAASQLALKKCVPQTEHKRDNVTDFDVLSDNPTTNWRPNEDDNSMGDMLSQLCSAASDPVKEYSFLSSLIKFFTGFRTFYVSGSSEGKVHDTKRKRGRPRKVFSQQATQDSSCSNDEKCVVRCKWARPRKVISQQASSDFSCSDDEMYAERHKRGMHVSNDNSLKHEKTVDKCKSGRPRKSTEVASPNSSDKYLVQKRPMGRPKKIDTHLSSQEDTEPVEKRKRGGPKKVNSEIASSNTPDHMKDSHCSDTDLQARRSGNSHMHDQIKRRKSTKQQLRHVGMNTNMRPTCVAERSVISRKIASSNTAEHMKDSHCSDTDLQAKRSGKSHMQDQIKRRKSTKEQLRHVVMNTNMRHACVAERSVISVEEKIVDESTPTALILRFNDANSLPSETHLIRIFSRYGPLKEAETDVMRKTNLAKVVFKRRIDASTAFSSAGKYSFFGPGLLSYQLKPCTPKYTNDAACMSTSQDNHNVTSVAMEQSKDELVPITTIQANHDLEATITLQDTCEEGPRRSDRGLPEQEDTMLVPNTLQNDAESARASPQDKHDPALVATPQENYDAAIASSLRDSTPVTAQENLNATTISMPRDNHDFALITTPKDNCDATITEGGNLKVSDQEGSIMDSEFIQAEDESCDLEEQAEARNASATTEVAVELKNSLKRVEFLTMA